jgi:prevent-host-death family protein
MRTITIRQLHERTGKLVRAAEKETFIVTERGRRVAVLKPLSDSDVSGKSFPKRRLSSLPKVAADSTDVISQERDSR